MNKSETYEIRLEMAHMHDEFLARLDKAMKAEEYVEASWLCYAIFEQRILRIIEKHISKCPKKKRAKREKPVGISTKLLCIKKLCKTGYGAYTSFDRALLSKIEKWCKARNTLIHGLVSLEHYKKYDQEFKSLAMTGVPLVKQLYLEASKVREWHRAGNSLGKFPEIKCRCEYRCIYEEK